jgi:hypothetical protein
MESYMLLAVKTAPSSSGKPQPRPTVCGNRKRGKKREEEEEEKKKVHSPPKGLITESKRIQSKDERRSEHSDGSLRE